MISYAALLLLAIAFNLGDWKMLALSCVIGAGIFYSIPPENFYITCAIGEAIIAGVAYFLQTNASKIIIRISIFLITFHLLGLRLDGYPAGSPYHLLVKVFEHAELLVCILLSNPIIKKMNYGKN